MSGIDQEDPPFIGNSDASETFTFGSPVFDGLERLRLGVSAEIPNAASENASDDALGNSTKCSELRASFPRTVSHSSGSISQIRALTILDAGTFTVQTETISVESHSQTELSKGIPVAPRHGVLSEETLKKTDHSALDETGVTTECDAVDTADGPFEVQCTSNYLPKDSSVMRHAAASFKTQPQEPEPDKIDTVVIEEEADYTLMPEWRNQRRQLFIFSNSGKPIYSRHGEEDRLVTLCGVMQALISVVNDTNDNQLWSIRTVGTTISFLVKTPLVMVTVAKTGESDRQLVTYLNYAYDFIISVLTLPQLSRIFVRYPNFDLRRMLSGTEKILDRLVDWFDEDFGFLLESVRCLPLPPTLRDTVNSLLAHSCHKIPGLVFAVVMAKRQLIALSQLRKYSLHPSDIRLLINLVDASDSFKTAESWIPICLPKFDSGGFLHAYITYLRDSPVCLIYLGVDPNLFHALAKSSASFISKMESTGYLDSVLTAMSSTALYTAQHSGVADLRHFVYKSTNAAQLTSPLVGYPYSTDPDLRHVLRGFYRYLHRKMHCPTRSAKVIVVTSNTEMLLGWLTGSFELYAVLEPSISKHHAVVAIEKLIKWIKKEENQLFILNSPDFA